MKAALSRAAGRISSSDGLDEAPRVCRDCGKPLQSWEFSRCGECTDRTLNEVADHSFQWLADDDTIVGYQERLNAELARRSGQPNSLEAANDEYSAASAVDRDAAF